MRIEIVRTGGVAGLRSTFSLDTDTLQAAERHHLEVVLRELAASPAPEIDSDVADGYQYDVALPDLDARITLRDPLCDEHAAVIDTLTSRSP